MDSYSKILGPIKIIKKIGCGGFGCLYKVTDKNGRIYAIKTLSEKGLDRPDSKERFYHECKVMAKLDHPIFTKCFGVEKDGDSLLLVTEYVDGIDLRDRIEKHGLFTIKESLSIIRQIAIGLKYLKNKKIIHRDLKLENILITKDKNIKIIDFGLSSSPMLEIEEFEGEACGTIQYMAPEYIFIDGKYDERIDIYSLGVLSYILLEGRLPFNSKNKIELAHMHLEDDVPLMALGHPAIESIVYEMLEKKPEYRITLDQIIEETTYLISRMSS